MPKKNEEPTFEQAMDRLESLIGAMEDGEIPLAELVEKFEEGTKLLEVCRDQLKQAELKIEKLNVDKGKFEPMTDIEDEA